MSENAPPEVIHADKNQRKLALLAVVIILAGGAACLWWLDRRLDVIDRLAEDDLAAAAEQARTLVGTAVLFAGLSFVGVGLWLFQLGVRINRAGRFPPPGMKVVRDTVVRTGFPARVLANVAMMGSVLAVLAGTAGAWYVLQVAHTLLEVR